MSTPCIRWIGLGHSMVWVNTGQKTDWVIWRLGPSWCCTVLLRLQVIAKGNIQIASICIQHAPTSCRRLLQSSISQCCQLSVWKTDLKEIQCENLPFPPKNHRFGYKVAKVGKTVKSSKHPLLRERRYGFYHLLVIWRIDSGFYHLVVISQVTSLP